ncbi:hypothetical protein ASG39_10315 [Rhizobium sp. Leaf371]|uniref:DUF6894 family protein n=1 Tax=Rhizobium sp. Leaf371 TaxID=1736355 RepID=UPI000715DDF1|nr:hypothetical protein [Rhizobium sp. Leaf371]KQS65577.1 hypothetical protein ASG39_10315 [Rhizobium sp. Leaf371]
MPRYYFQIVERNAVLDDLDGADVASLAEARREAERAIREIAAEHLKIERKLELTSIQIRDEAGDVVASVTYDEAMDDILP